MANYIDAAEKIAIELGHFMPEILKQDTVLHRYFEFISFCSQVYYEYVNKELDTEFVKLAYRIIPRPYRFSPESRIEGISADADRVFCIESNIKSKYIFIAGCEKNQENEDDNKNLVFVFNCDFYEINGLKSFSMFYLTICEALSIFRKNNSELAQDVDFSTLNSWIRQHSGKVSKQYFMAQSVSSYFTSFALFSRFMDFKVYSGSKWGLDRLYTQEFPEGVTIQGDNHTFTVVKEVVTLPGTIGPISGANIYLSRLGHVDHWRSVEDEIKKATLFRQPSLSEDSFKDLVDDMRNYILNEIQF